MKNSILYITVAILLGLACTACSEEQAVGPGIAEGNATIAFQMNLPETSTATTPTRGGTVANPSDYENKISDVIVLIFGGASLRDCLQGTDIITTSASSKFNVTTLSTTAFVKVWLLANSGLNAADLTTSFRGKSMTEVKAGINELLTASVNAHGVTGFLPMWGEFELPAGIPPSDPATPTQVTGVKMLRAVAKAEIVKTVDDNTLKISSARIYRMTSKIAIMPASVTGGVVSAPTIPESAVKMLPVSGLDATSLPLTYYLTESAAAAALDASVTNATCLVIGGYFGGSPVETFYRIDFEKDMDSNGKTDQVGEILRNHHYRFNITSVTSPGWPTPDDAANNRSSNITVNVQDWALKQSETYQNSDHNLTVSSREITVAGTLNSENYMTVTSDIDNAGITFNGLSLSSPGTLESDNFSIIFAKSTVNGTTTYKITAIAKKTNTTSADIVELITLTANNLTVTLTVRQEVPEFINAATTFMWLTSDGTNPLMNIITSSGGAGEWSLVSKPSWVEYEVVDPAVNKDLIKVWAARYIDAASSVRTGVMVFDNKKGAQVSVTVQQSHMTYWTPAYLTGGANHMTDYTSPYYTGALFGVYFVGKTPSGTAVGLAATAGDIIRTYPKRKNAATNPDNYTMAGDYYSRENAVIACNKLTYGGVSAGKWRLPDYYEMGDAMLRFQKTTNGTLYLLEPDNTKNYFPYNGYMTVYPESDVLYLWASLTNKSTIAYVLREGASGALAISHNLGVRCVREMQ